MAWLTRGYAMDVNDVVGDAIFEEEHEHMIMVRDIELYSLCEHHMLPFFGRCHIGYIPNGRVFGVSKLARLVDMYARRLQLQERLTEQISQVVMDECGAKGVGVMIEARHLCMMMRGVEKTNSKERAAFLDAACGQDRALRQRQETLISERANLLQKNEQVRARVYGLKRREFHLKLDTGMTRLGIAPEEIVALAQVIRELPNVELDGIFTHFAMADDPDGHGKDWGREFTRQQLEQFRSAVDALDRAGIDVRQWIDHLNRRRPVDADSFRGLRQIETARGAFFTIQLELI